MASAASSFAAAFDASGMLRVPASDALRGILSKLRGQPAKPPRRLQDIPATRIAFDAMVAAAQRGNGLDDADAPHAIAHRRERIGGVPVVLVEPAGAIRGAVVHVHGGGWCVGGPMPLLPSLQALAHATSSVVASIDYRLAPEHPHPAAFEDCVRATAGLLERFRDAHGFGGERVVLAGESAGAQLALLSLPGLRDAGIRLAGVALAYGLFDLSNSLPSRDRAGPDAVLLDAEACRFYADAYLGGVDGADPSVSPWFLAPADLRGMPPALFCVGGVDPLYDDSVGMHARWREAGNEAWCAIYDAAPHAFDLLPVPEALHLARMRRDFVTHCLA